MRSTFAFLCVMLAGCGGPAPQSDGGPRPDAGGDGGSATQCTRVSDCASSAPCTTARCEPGNAMADARGCIVVSACAEDEVCQDDRCVPQCDVFDADSDGHDAEACAGDDCDDNDPHRYAGNPTICDVDNHDEDCRMDTLGPDLDADGFQSAACCELWGTNVLCGADCDDGDPAVNPSRPELCNGVDDDCDGMIDDGFDCIQNQVLTGDDGCGREGQRRCSESCTWLDDALVRSEDSSTCDYCADAGDALASEVVFATRAADYEIVGPSTFGDYRFGTYTCVSTYLFACNRGRLVSRTQHDSAGAYYTSTPYQIGYGTLEIPVSAHVTTNAGAAPGRGWVVVLADAGSPPELGLPENLGAPSPRHGWAIGVLFDDSRNDGVLGENGWDSVVIRYLGDGTERRALFMRDDVKTTTTSQTTTQTLTIAIQPDLPWTSDDETQIAVTYPPDPRYPTLGGTTRCEGSACGGRILPGDRFYMGASGATSSLTTTIEIGPSADSMATMTAHATSLCP